MKKVIVYSIGLVFVLSFLMAACSGNTLTPQAEVPKSAESLVTEEPEPTESVVTEEPEPTESVVTEEPKSAEIVVTEEPKIAGPRIGEIVPEFSLPDSYGNEVSLADTLQENEQVVIVFYYGSGCTPCMAQLSEIENDRARYEEKGAQVMAIAVQSEGSAERSAKISDAQFPILADSEHTVAEAFGVLEDGYWSTPSVFVIDQDRNIVWSEITHIEGYGCGTERVPSQTILDNLG